MVIQDFTSKVVFLDAAPFIYYIEEHPDFIGKLDALFWANGQGKVKFITSSMTLLEVLVVPFKTGDDELANTYMQIFRNSAGLKVHPLNNPISVIAAGVRAHYNIKSPDAVQIATALNKNADFFLTNDAKLKRVEPEIVVITLDEL